jgi:hypothetical protein
MEVMTPARAVTRRYLPNSPFQAPPAQPVVLFALQDRVSHDRFGLGRVIGIEENIAVLVEFGDRQERILTPTSKLHKL